MGIDLESLIEQQRASLENPPEVDIPVVLAGQRLTVTVMKARPDDYQALIEECPPRKGVTEDANIGYNQTLLPRQYPVERLRVAGEAVSREAWANLFSVVDVAYKTNLHTAMFQLNMMDTLTELQRLGKAEAGQSSNSPANRESRRAASKGGSREK
jgi:hypothetical protein